MSKYPSRQDRDEIRALLQQFENLKSGKTNSFLEEDSFERIIDYYDEKEQLPQALEASEYGIEQYPYSSLLLLKKADLLIKKPWVFWITPKPWIVKTRIFIF